QHLPHRHLGMLDRQAHEADIDPAGDESFDLAERGHVCDLDLDSGAGLTKSEQSAWNQTVYGGHAHTQAQFSEFATDGAAYRLEGYLDVAHDSSRVPVEQRSGRGQRHPAPVANQQRPADFFFQTLDPLA